MKFKGKIINNLKPIKFNLMESRRKSKQIDTGESTQAFETEQLQESEEDVIRHGKCFRNSLLIWIIDLYKPPSFNKSYNEPS